MLATVFAVLGPTASGKSRLALELAQRLPIELVSVDSAQVYRGMDIGTAKPTAQERQTVPHHLIDLIDPTEAYSAGRFRADAIASAAAVLARGRIPLLVGGTMLYYRALAHGIDALPAADATLRAAIAAEAQRRGWARLHAELTKVDPITARRVSPGDAQRIQRALEVYRATGRPISAFHRGARTPLPFALRGFALQSSDRARLHARIARRFDTMLANGLIEELRGLRQGYALHAGLPSMRCVGYRQAWRYLEGEYGRATLRERGVAATRQLAKRQLTWLRALTEVEPCDADEPSLPARLAERISRAAML